MSTSARTCPACHQPLPADAPQGLCPQCLAKSALGSQPGSEETLASGSKPGGSGSATIQPEIARLFPQLEIMEPLGQGGMGMVYKARQPQLDRIVALKVMRADLSRDPVFAERFAREARALAKLNHPNIVSVFDFGQSGGHCWFLMEFVDGRNLRELLRTKTLTPREALSIVPKVCDALQYAHDEGIVHRDIKPENILLDKKGRVKIADFGLAKLVGKDASEFSLTATGMTLGTPRYMAPEQFDKPQEVDHRADIYSLGVVLYEMLTGEVPMGRFAPPSATVGVDVRLDEVVLRSLEKEPSRRYQHASEVKTQVESIAGIVANLPPVLRQALGFEYKSKTEWFGLPLLHIAYGMDLQTGKTRVAKGILAIGNVAKGVVAFGGAAYGGIAFGGFAVGVVAIAGCGIGLVSFAGLAIALLAAYGGLAVAPVALGGFAAGYFACGGAAFGAHAVGGNANDPEARRFFGGIMANWKTLNTTGLALMAVSFVVPFFATFWARRHAAVADAQPGGDATGAPAPVAQPDGIGRSSLGLALAGIVLPIGLLLLALAVAPREHQSGMLILCVVLGALVELAAFGCGVVGRRSLAGKAGMVISGLVLLAGLVLGPSVILRPGERTSATSRPAPTARSGSGPKAAVEPARSGQESEPPIFHTFGGETGFVKGPDGPIYSRASIAKFGFTPLQAEEVNKITPRYYRDFLSLERQHTTVKTDANGRVQVTIAPFRDAAIALAERMVKEIRGTTGKEIVPGGYDLRGVGIVGFLGLFRHEGAREVKAELWKDAAGYHFTEAFGTDKDEFGGTRSGGSRTLHGKTWKEAFPEEYWIYWNEQ